MRTPEEYEAYARELFLEGRNCAQSVAAAFADVLQEAYGLEEAQILRMASPFGGGMGRMREVCGCVSGMLLVLGSLYGYDAADAYEEKQELYEKTPELMNTFRERHGSFYCRDLLGEEGQSTSSVPSKRTTDYYDRRPCPDLAADAARILAEKLAEMQEN